MADVSISTAQFKPFSYAEMLAPLKDATDAQKEIENSYSDLSTLAEVLKERALKEPDALWSKKFLSYSNRLQQLADDLINNGLNPQTRRGLIGAKRDFASSVATPLEAIKQQQVLSNIRAQLNPALRMVYGSMPTVDQLIADPTATSTDYSGAAVYEQARNSSAAASARHQVTQIISRIPQLKEYFELIKQKGYNLETWDLISKIQALQGIVEQVENLFGNFEGVSDANKEKLKAEVKKGIFDGVIYDSQESIQHNEYEAGMRQQAYDWKKTLANFAFQRERLEDAQAHEKEMLRLRELEERKKAVAAARAAAEAQGQLPGGVPGSTGELHFNDANASAGMKLKFAKQTLEYLKWRSTKGKDPEAKKIIDYWKKNGGSNWQQAAMDHWINLGFNGKGYIYDSKGKLTGLGVGLRAHLRKNASGDENLVNIWTSPYKSVVKKDDGKEISFTRNFILVGGPAVMAYDATPRKQWDNWDDRSRTSYTVNVTALHDDPAAIAPVIQRTLTMSGRNKNGKYKLYDITSIDKNGVIQHSLTGTDPSLLPHKSATDKTVDFTKILRYRLHNGDYILSWPDDDGNIVQKLLLRGDMSKEAQANWNTIYNAEVSNYNKLQAGEITKAEYDLLMYNLLLNDLTAEYIEGLEVKVDPYNITKL